MFKNPTHTHTSTPLPRSLLFTTPSPRGQHTSKHAEQTQTQLWPTLLRRPNRSRCKVDQGVRGSTPPHNVPSSPHKHPARPLRLTCSSRRHSLPKQGNQYKLLPFNLACAQCFQHQTSSRCSGTLYDHGHNPTLLGCGSQQPVWLGSQTKLAPPTQTRALCLNPPGAPGGSNALCNFHYTVLYKSRLRQPRLGSRASTPRH